MYSFSKEGRQHSGLLRAKKVHCCAQLPYSIVAATSYASVIFLFHMDDRIILYCGSLCIGLHISLTSEHPRFDPQRRHKSLRGAVSGRASGVKECQMKCAELAIMLTSCE